ncbi:GrpB family protein [Paenibacillus aurantius]|uniref:GrpB family protein n=1 Tax=Paenibacillus aurantius TaxID=2918900 RepID=A0AA96LH98_9BACL|nr:GrpB family protein [Paenibacillus aurantius]WNQ11971.1 GrpB family protein [Paenibacillus aurantius]
MEQVVITDHNPQWVRQYEQERTAIAEALADIVQGIEHIGSTSVPGLAAKPVIDIMAGVEDLEKVNDRHLHLLERIGYLFVPHPHFPERLFFRRGEWRAGTHHLHVYRYQGKHWVDQLLFKQYLIRHPEAAAEYQSLKGRLAERYQHDRVQYTEAKGPFIEEILKRARMEGGPPLAE